LAEASRREGGSFFGHECVSPIPKGVSEVSTSLFLCT
jgi:hypothetical protein